MGLVVGLYVGLTVRTRGTFAVVALGVGAGDADGALTLALGCAVGAADGAVALLVGAAVGTTPGC